MCILARRLGPSRRALPAYGLAALKLRPFGRVPLRFFVPRSNTLWAWQANSASHVSKSWIAGEFSFPRLSWSGVALSGYDQFTSKFSFAVILTRSRLALVSM